MSDETEAEGWSEEKVYDEQISPLMTQIIAICKAHKIPMVASFAYEDSPEDGPGLCTTSLPVKERPVPVLERAAAVIYPPRAPLMMITTKDKDGKVVSMEAIVP